MPEVTRHPRQAAGRVRADGRGYTAVTLAATAITFAAGWGVSAIAQSSIGVLAGLPPALSFLVPVAIDGALLSNGLAVASKAARGRSTRASWVWLIAFTIVSLALNTLHAAISGALQSGPLAAVAIILLSATMPLSILSSAESLLAVALQPVEGDAAHRQAMARVNDRAAATPQAVPAARPKRGSALALDEEAAIRDSWSSGTFPTKRSLAAHHGTTETAVRNALNPGPAAASS